MLFSVKFLRSSSCVLWPALPQLSLNFIMFYSGNWSRKGQIEGHILCEVFVVQSLSHVQLFVTPWTAARQASLSFTILELAQTHVHWINDAIQPSYPLSSPFPPAFNLSQHHGLFQWVSSLHQVVKVLELWLQHQSSNEYSGLISFRMDWLIFLKIDWFDLLAVQGTLKSLFQHHNLKA